MHAFSKLATVSLLVAASLHVQGADLAAENWHQIEVIVFSQQDDFGIEQSPTDPKLGYPSRLVVLNDGEQLHSQLSANSSRDERLAALMVPPRFLSHESAKEPVPYSPLEASERQLNPDADTLNRNGNYRVLFHQAWRQPVTGKKQSQWLFINGGNSYGNHSELEGSLRIFHSRFYHIETNLWLSRFEPAPPADTTAPAPTTDTQQTAATPVISLPEPPAKPKSANLLLIESIAPEEPSELPFSLESSTVNGLDAAVGPNPAQFKVKAVDVLNTSDQLRRKTLFYIDHPRMGVLVLVTPVSDETEDDSEETFE